MNKFFKSSTGSGDVALTVKAALVAMVPTIILVLKLLGIEVAEEQLLEIIQAITAIIASVLFLYGVARKGYYFLKEKGIF